MNTLRIEYPAEILWALQKQPEEFEREARLLLAFKLYQDQKLSSGLAAQLAGIPRVVFLFLLGQHEISPFEENTESLAQDLAYARQASR
ncbi:MAG: hypothetical protein OHK0052_00240 [Anaerolineales bacterium]